MTEQTPNTAANDVEQLIRDQIKDNKVILYMKGTPQFPQCGFSAKSIEVLTQIGRPFAFVNILENPEIRATLPKIGQGIDVHAFHNTGEQQQYVILAGVPIEHTHSLLAHSDGDVVLHALADALLGALALGDIGQHFPDTDMAHAGLDSRVLLRYVYGKVQAAGYTLGNADITVMCERPKLAPYNQAMRDNIASDLQTDVSNVSIKATTTEKLGFTGRQEGIMVNAVVLLAPNA